MDQKEKKRGRPRKAPNEGTDKQKQQREYMRNYVSQINNGIKQLEKDEADCLKELDRVRKEKKALIDELDKANKQASNILKEKVKK